MEHVLTFMVKVLMFILEKVKEVPLLLRSFVIQDMASFDLLFPPEKRAEMIDQWIPALRSYVGMALAAVKTSGEMALSWLDEVSPPEARAEKVNRLQLALRSYGGAALAAIKKSGGEALGWFDEIFPPETRAEKLKQWLQQIPKPYLIGAMVVVVVVCLGRCCGRETKMMKAPGRSIRIPRAVFESDPKAYFRNLRS